jgi:ABC-2 type transport system permease protein
LLLAVPLLARPAGAAGGDPAFAGASVGELVLGELAAAGVVTAALLATAAPAALATVAMGGVGVGHLLIVPAVLWLVLACVAAMAQRGAGRTVAGVAVLCFGTVGVYHLAKPHTWHTVMNSSTCFDANLTVETCPDLRTELRPEMIWWLLAPNPFVVVADAAPKVRARYGEADSSFFEPERLPEAFDPLSEIGRQVRAVRDPHLDSYYHGPGYFTSSDEAAPDPAPVWPYGLAADLGLATLAVGLAVRRPMRVSDAASRRRSRAGPRRPATSPGG